MGVYAVQIAECCMAAQVQGQVSRRGGGSSGCHQQQGTLQLAARERPEAAVAPARGACKRTHLCTRCSQVVTLGVRATGGPTEPSRSMFTMCCIALL